jgi:hypothetical protein
MMRLPLVRGELGELKRCPFRKGGTYKLQPRTSVKAATSITIIEVRQEKLAALSLADAKREGYAGIQGALEAFRHRWPNHGEAVWVVRFAKDDKDHTVSDYINSDQPLYLAKHGDFTTSASTQAVRGDPPYLAPLAEDLARARLKAAERRLTPQQLSISRMRAETDTLLNAMTAMKDRNRVKRIRKELEALDDKLSVEESGTLAQVAPAESPVPAQSKATPGQTAEPLVSLEPAA